MRGLCLSLETLWKEGVDNWVLGLAKKEGKKLERGNRTAAGPPGKDPGQARSNAISSPGFLAPPPMPLEHFLLAAPTHTGCKDFTKEDRGLQCLHRTCMCF